MTTPLLSVVLPVYNGAKDVRQAIDSLLAQTFTDFEILVINDGSKDETAQVLNRISEPRIRILHQDNMGLARTLNRGISLSRGRYIARQDQDDLSRPTRFEKQLAFMEANQECALLGTWAEIWRDNAPSGRYHDHPTDDPSIRFELLFNNPFVHSSVVLRKDAVLSVGGYTTDKSRQPPEDYELWSRLSRRYMVANLPERLHIYREVHSSMSRTGPNPFLEKLVLVCSENIAHSIGSSEVSPEIVDIAALTHSAIQYISPHPDLMKMVQVLLDAGHRIAKASPNSDVLQRLEERINILHRQYFGHLNNLAGRSDKKRIHRFVQFLKNIERIVWRQ